MFSARCISSNVKKRKNGDWAGFGHFAMSEKGCTFAAVFEEKIKSKTTIKA